MHRTSSSTTAILLSLALSAQTLPIGLASEASHDANPAPTTVSTHLEEDVTVVDHEETAPENSASNRGPESPQDSLDNDLTSDAVSEDIGAPAHTGSTEEPETPADVPAGSPNDTVDTTAPTEKEPSEATGDDADSTENPSNPETPVEPDNLTVDADAIDPSPSPATDSTIVTESNVATEAIETTAVPAVLATTPQSPSLKADVSKDGSSLALRAEGGDYAQAWNVSFKITGPRGTTWHAATKQQDGAWTCTLSSAAFGSGAITIEAWASIGSSPARSIGATQAKVPGAQASFSLAWDDSSDRLLLTASNVTCPSGVTFVSAGVAAPNSSLRWYQLKLQDNGTWAIAINPADFNWASGTYQVVGSICDAGWQGISAGNSTLPVSYAGEQLNSTVSADGAVLSIQAQGGRLDRAWGVSFAITGPNGTQWVAAKKQSDGSWLANVNNSRLGSGSCTIVAWANIGSSPAVSVLQKDSSIPSARANVTLSYSANSKRFVLSASNVGCPSGVRFVSVGVMPQEGQTKWYRLEKDDNGEWSALINPSDFGWQAGTYRLIPSICDTDWKGIELPTTTSSIAFDTKLAATTDANNGTVTLVASGTFLGGATNVAFAISGDGTTGHTTTTWHQAQRQSNGTWTATVKASQIGSGSCTATTVVAIGGSTQYLSKATFAIGGASGTVVPSNPTNNVIPVTVSSLSSKTGVQRVSLGVFNGSTSRWYNCTKDAQGNWTVQVPLADFKFAGGVYTFEPVVIDNFGNSIPLKKASKQYTSATASVSAEINSSNNLEMSVSGGSSVYAWGVSFAVTDSGGSTEWVAAQKQSDGTWKASIPASKLTYGGGTVKAYANAGSSSISLGSDYFNRLQPSHVGMSQYIQNYSSPTSYLLAIDTRGCSVGVYSGSRGHWEEIAHWSCSPGAPGTPTVTGVFSVTGKGYSFDSFGSRCFYYTQFYGDYLFHSTLYYPSGGIMDNRLGMQLSHGCVRLNINNAKWIYDNIPYGTTVVSF